MSRRLFDLAHARAGDKGNTSTLSVFAYRPEDYEYLRQELTAERVRLHLAGIVEGDVVRYELPKLAGFQFICERALLGGVNTSLALDTHGKSLSYALLELTL